MLTALIASVSWPSSVLELLRLLLQHAQVGHHLLMFLVGGARRRGGTTDERSGERRSAEVIRVVIAAHFAVMTKCARRFFDHAASSWPGSNGNSLP